VKKADLEKLKGSKISGQMKQSAPAARFGSQAAAVPDRREQRKLDQSLGLVPFAVKLNSELIAQVHALAQARGASLNEIVGELLTKGLKS
jgi:hypothetical protein